MMFMRKYFTITCLLLLAVGMKAQEHAMVVELTDGTERTYSLANGKVTFDDAMMYLTDDTYELVASVVIDDIRKIYFRSLAGMTEADNAALLMVYPNPARDWVKVANAENARVGIFSMDGRMMYNGMNSGDKIDVSVFPSGVYFIRVDGQTLKFVKL